MAGLLRPPKLQQPLTDFVRPPSPLDSLNMLSRNLTHPPTHLQRLAEKLGQGAFGSVYKVRLRLPPVRGLNSIDRLMLISRGVRAQTQALNCEV